MSMNLKDLHFGSPISHPPTLFLSEIFNTHGTASTVLSTMKNLNHTSESSSTPFSRSMRKNPRNSQTVSMTISCQFTPIRRDSLQHSTLWFQDWIRNSCTCKEISRRASMTSSESKRHMPASWQELLWPLLDLHQPSLFNKKLHCVFTLFYVCLD